MQTWLWSPATIFLSWIPILWTFCSSMHLKLLKHYVWNQSSLSKPQMILTEVFGWYVNLLHKLCEFTGSFFFLNGMNHWILDALFLTLVSMMTYACILFLCLLHLHQFQFSKSCFLLRKWVIKRKLH